jgi:hypothetical protein
LEEAHSFRLANQTSGNVVHMLECSDQRWWPRVHSALGVDRDSRAVCGSRKMQ